MMSFINIYNINKNFNVGKRKVSVLEDINFQVDKGDFILIVGESGSGKTTLLNMIAGLDKPDSGKIVVDSINISSLTIDQLSLWRSDNIGFIFQNYNLLSYMNALNNVALPLVFRGETNKDRIKRSLHMLKMVGLKDIIDSPCHVLSGGEQQRVAIARALVNSPKILLADEPTGNLDDRSSKDVMDILFSLYKERKTTIIMATHKLEYSKYADKIIEIKDGVIKK